MKTLKSPSPEQLESVIRDILGDRIYYVNSGENIKIMPSYNYDYRIVSGINTADKFYIYEMRVGFYTNKSKKRYLKISDCSIEATNRDGTGSKKIRKPIIGTFILITEDQFNICIDFHENNFKK